MESARKGKVASLPAKIRAEINQRLHDGQAARQILPWLNADAEVLRVLDDRWHEEPVTPQNLSEWRQGGYQDWLNRNEKVGAIKVLSAYAFELAQASGGSITEGAAAVAGGRILETLEKSVAAEQDPEFINALVALRRAEIAQKRTDILGKRANQSDVALAQRDRQLALEEKRFQRQTAELFLQWYTDKRAKEIIDTKGPKDVKMDQLVTLMFGEKPSTAGSSEGGEPG